MNIALIGYGRMGHEIEAVALRRGHSIGLIIEVDNTADLNSEKLAGIDVAIEFSAPESAFENVCKCLELAVPVVSGTTGWIGKYEAAVAICNRKKTSFIHSSNFSIGVNLFFKLNELLAGYISDYLDYTVSIEEIHHINKLDAPSGTALTLVKGVTANHPGYTGWNFADGKQAGHIPVKSVREGEVPGTHIVAWESDIDTITLRHEAKNRKGFALGAVVAAEYINKRKGIFTMNDIMGF